MSGASVWGVIARVVVPWPFGTVALIGAGGNLDSYLKNYKFSYCT